MTPITRWFEAQVSVPLEGVYRRIDEAAAELDAMSATPAPATPRKSRVRFRKAA